MTISNISTLNTSIVLDSQGRPVTSSLVVAEIFNKNHRDVLRSITNVLADLPEEFNQRNFALVDYTDAKGEKRASYNLTRDAFTLVAMGFTGKQALAFKLAYIEAFNRMEAEITAKRVSRSDTPLPQNLTPAMQHHIQTEVNKLARKPGNSYQGVYHAIKVKFQVGTYKDIPASKYRELCSFLGCQPTAEEPAEQIAPTPELLTSPAYREQARQHMLEFADACRAVSSGQAATFPDYSDIVADGLLAEILCANRFLMTINTQGRITISQIDRGAFVGTIPQIAKSIEESWFTSHFSDIELVTLAQICNATLSRRMHRA